MGGSFGCHLSFLKRLFFASLAAAFLLLQIPPAYATVEQADKLDASAAQKKSVFDIRPILTQARKAVIAGDKEKADRIYTFLTTAFPKMTFLKFEHANAMAKLGDRSKVREIMTPLDTSILPANQRSNYQNLMWNEQGFSMTFAPKFLYDSNLNGGAQNNVVMIGGIPFSLSDDAMATGGFGTGGTLALNFLEPVSDSTALGATIVADANLYEDNEFDDLSLSASAGPRFLLGPAMIRTNILGGTRFVGGSHLEDHIGGQVSSTLESFSDFPVLLSYSKRYYEGADTRLPTRDRETDSYNVTTLIKNQLPWRGNAMFGIGYEDEDWKRNAEDNHAYRANLSIEMPMNGYVDPVLISSISNKRYDNIIGLLGVARDEWRYEIGTRLDITMIKTPFGAPYVQYSYIRNDSNVSFTDYDQHRFTTGFVIRKW